jgi:Family of unknown function (DUF6516)
MPTDAWNVCACASRLTGGAARPCRGYSRFSRTHVGRSDHVVTGKKLSTLLGQVAVLKASPKVPKSPEIGRIIPLDLDGQTLPLILYRHDGTHLRLTEQWNGDALGRNSYYWLTTTNELKIGWDNVPHHTHLATFPHHKRDGHQSNIQPSTETRLEEVMTFIRTAET